MPKPQESPVPSAPHHFGAWSKLILAMALLVASTSQAVTPELLALQQQYAKLLNDRVTTVYEAGVVQLNARYLEAVDRSIATVKAAGDLTEVLALESEKNLINDKKSIPDDDADTKDSVKKLRTVYREQLGKLEGQRSTDHAAILGPYLTRLKALEVDLTKTNRVADAKEVLDYRSGLGDDPASTPVLPASNGALTNSLGMKFLPVKGTDVLFCIHETRRKDFAQYADTAPVAHDNWKKNENHGAPLEDGDNQPAFGIGFADAVAFCEWLSKKEGKTYRLPTDKEWSYAAGIGHKEKWTKGTTPEMRMAQKVGDYPWGKNFPPKTADRVGNYADMSRHEKFEGDPFISDYTDGVVATAPVMSFKPNEQGLYDIGGNVAEWVSDWWNDDKSLHVLRGGSWITSSTDDIRSSHRSNVSGGTSYYLAYGFRVVLERP